jgi:hypothetical protein
MHRKLTLTILAAASLGAIALAPTAASARHFGGGGWGGDFHHDHFDHFDHHFGIGFVGGGYDNGCFVTRSVPTPFGYRLRTINVCGY